MKKKINKNEVNMFSSHTLAILIKHVNETRTIIKIKKSKKKESTRKVHKKMSQEKMRKVYGSIRYDKKLNKSIVRFFFFNNFSLHSRFLTFLFLFPSILVVFAIKILLSCT